MNLFLQVFAKETSEFLRESINFVLSEREKSGNSRQDLIDTLLLLKNEDKGKSQSQSNFGWLKKLMRRPNENHFTESFSG